MGVADEFSQGRESARRHAAERQEQRRQDVLAGSARTRRSGEIRAAIAQFLELMGSQNNPGAVGMRPESNPPKQTIWQALLGKQPALPPVILGWQISETGVGPETVPVYLALTIDGRLFMASQAPLGPVGEHYKPATWVLYRPLTLGNPQGEIEERLMESIPRGLGRVLQENGL